MERDRCPECDECVQNVYVSKNLSGKRTMRKLWNVRYCGKCGLLIPIEEDEEDEC